jgi:hypothetical protein
VALRDVPPPSAGALEFGIPLFVGQLIATLRAEETKELPEDDKLPPDIGSTAGKHGNELLRKGYTIDQVVHDYGDLCQAVTELATEKRADITTQEFRTFNRCLDNAIADAVTEFGRQRDVNVAETGAQTMNERLAIVARQLRGLVNSATLSFQAIQGGNVTLNGATAGVLGRNLAALREVIDRSLADLRLTDGLQLWREPISIRELIDDVQISSIAEAKARGLHFAISPVGEDLSVDADRQMLTSALANLLENAFTFTLPGGHISLRAYAKDEHVHIEIEDQCGGLAPGKTEELARPLEPRNGDRAPLGSGLSISRRGVEANGGRLGVRNLPGKGCVFSIELPASR